MVLAAARSSRRWTGTSAIARIPCGDSVSAALSNSAARDLLDGDSGRLASAPAASAPRSVSAKPCGDQGAAYVERRAEQLFDAADPFGDEQALALPGFSAAKVAGEGEESIGHWEYVLPLRRPISSIDEDHENQSMRRFVAGAAMAATLGMSTACGISQQQEVQIGAEQSQQVNAQLPIVQDPCDQSVPPTSSAIRWRTSRRGRISSGSSTWSTRTTSTRSRSPAGTSTSTAASPSASTNMDEFASVLAHEIGHVVLRHSVKQMEQMQGANIGVTIACVLTGVCNSGLDPGRHQRRRPGGLREVQPRRRGAGRRGRHRRAGARGHQPERHAVDVREAARRAPEPARRRSTRGSPTTRSRKSRIQATRDQIAKINPAIIRTLTTNTQAFNDFKARVRTLPPPPRRGDR